MLNHIGRSDILLITLDTLRYDVAQELFLSGLLPNLAHYLPSTGWQRRHTPATFTYAAHHAFFAGFLPTPIGAGVHPRLFAAEFAGSESTSKQTFVFPEATLPQALSRIGYHTLCVGGTGFFNSENALGSVLPGLFDESHWSKSMSVVERDSALNQVDCAVNAIKRQSDKRVFCFINFSAIHQPNWFYAADVPPVDGRDTLIGHGEALIEIDRQLPRLLYLHLPFCEMRCGFCNLFTASQPPSILVDQTLRAISIQSRAVADAIDPQSIAQVAVGGGTPTYLEAAELGRVLKMISSDWPVAIGNVPFSMEVSPATVDATKLSLMVEHGVRRISMGVQSFVQRDLNSLGRPQQNDQVERAIELIGKCGVEIFNLDLIYGNHDQSEADWVRTVERGLT